MALDYTQTFLLTVPLVNISEIYLSIRVRYKQELLGLAWLGYLVFSDHCSNNLHCHRMESIAGSTY